MFLAIDLGNTNIVFALYQHHDSQHQKIASWRMQTLLSRTADEYAALIQQWLLTKDMAWSDISGIAISSVVPAALPHLQAWAEKYFDGRTAVVGTDGFYPDMEILLDVPGELGADRLINAWQAYRQYGVSIVVIDFGTATTFDVVNDKGQYCGGIIAPGIELSLQALCLAAAQLSMTDFQKPANIVGRDTKTAMQSGFFYGTVGMIENMLMRIRQEMGGIEKVIATGGLSVLIVPECSAIDAAQEDLTLKGLVTLYHEKFCR